MLCYAFPTWRVLWSVAIFKIFLGVYLIFFSLLYFFTFIFNFLVHKRERRSGAKSRESKEKELAIWATQGRRSSGEGKKRGRRRGEKERKTERGKKRGTSLPQGTGALLQKGGEGGFEGGGMDAPSDIKEQVNWFWFSLQSRRCLTEGK